MSVNKNFPNYSKAIVHDRILVTYPAGPNHDEKRKAKGQARRWPAQMRKMKLVSEHDRQVIERRANILKRIVKRTEKKYGIKN